MGGSSKGHRVGGGSGGGENKNEEFEEKGLRLGEKEKKTGLVMKRSAQGDQVVERKREIGADGRETRPASADQREICRLKGREIRKIK